MRLLPLPWSISPARARQRGFSVAVAASLLVAGLSVPKVTAGAVSAPDPISCAATASVLATTTTGALLKYPLTNPSSATAHIPSYSVIGSGWHSFGRVLAGPSGAVYAISNRTADYGSMYYYHYTGTYFDVQRRLMSTGWSSFASVVNHDKITVDEKGHLYALDGIGTLRHYYYDVSQGKFTTFGQPLITGWSGFNLIAAAGDGIIYTRTPLGALYRYRYDTAADRAIVDTHPSGAVGSGWGTFTRGITSIGGDVLLGTRSTGLYQYRRNNDGNAWPVGGHLIGSAGFAAFTNIVGFTDACTLTTTLSPSHPALPQVRNAAPAVVLRTAAIGSGARSVEFAYADNGGRLFTVRQPDRDATGAFQPRQLLVDQLDRAVTGRPQLVEDATGATLSVFGLVSNGDVWRNTRIGSATTVTSYTDRAVLTSPPTVRLRDDKTIEQLGVDADGRLWAKKQNGTAATYFPWRHLSEPTGKALVGPVTVAKYDLGIAAIAARDSTGAIWFTTLTDAGLIGAWTPLGGPGFTDSPAIIVAPGPKVTIIARTASGSLVTTAQPATGAPFPATWRPIAAVGAPVTAGSPSAILSPTDGRIVVFSRGTDGSIYASQETSSGCGTFSPWWATLLGASTPYFTDPTAYVVESAANVAEWGVATLNYREELTVQYRRDAKVPTPPSSCVAANLARATSHPTFTTRVAAK
jgi:hypothetical protein